VGRTSCPHALTLGPHFFASICEHSGFVMISANQHFPQNEKARTLVRGLSSSRTQTLRRRLHEVFPAVLEFLPHSSEQKKYFLPCGNCAGIQEHLVDSIRQNWTMSFAFSLEVDESMFQPMQKTFRSPEPPQ